MRPAGRRSFLAAAMALLLGVADAQDRVTSLDVVCPNQKATLQMTADNATYYCGTDSSKSQIHWVQMAVDFQVNVQAKSMELNVSDGEILGTLNVTGSSGSPALTYSQNPLNIAALINLKSLRFEAVTFAERLLLALPNRAFKNIYFVDSKLADLSLHYDVPLLESIDLSSTTFDQIPSILYEWNYSTDVNITANLSLVQEATTLSSGNYSTLMANVGSEVDSFCKAPESANGVIVTCVSEVSLSGAASSRDFSSSTGGDPIASSGRSSSGGSAVDADAGDSGSGGVSTGALVAIIVVVVVIAAVLAFFILRMYFKRKAAHANAQNEATTTLMGKGDTAADKGSFISNDEFLRNFRLPQSDVSLLKSVGTGRLWVGEFNGGKVVVKRVESEVTDSFVTKALMAQARTFATISHPNITSLVGVTWLAGTDFAVVTEFMDKGNLKTVLSNSDVELDVSTKLQMCLDVALALAYLHETEQNLCAKQLSSRKVLVNKAMSCKLSLFECVPSSAKLGGPSTAATYSYGMGEVAWLPPEVITRSSPMDARKNNIFAFGVLVSEIFTRVSPYQSLVETQGNTMSDVELVKRVRHQEPLVPHENRREFLEAPPSVRQLVDQCLSYAPMSRPTAKDLLEILHNAKEELATNSI